MSNTNTTNTSIHSKKNSNRIYQIIALAIPLLFFALLEGGLRCFDYGREMSLFIDYPDKNETPVIAYLLPRPDVVKRYFPESSAAPTVTIEPNLFLKNKPEHGLRIVVQGGSTAAGFPFGYGASIAGMLDYRLKQSFPDRTVEVINTALAAVNSYTVLDFVDEIIEQRPDAVLIYAGHNEYLGILGVGSAYTAANSPAATLLYLKLKDLKTFQLLQNTYFTLRTSINTGDSTDSAADTKRRDAEQNKVSRTFMSKVAKHKNIPLGSELYHKGLAQFERNIALVIEKYQAAGIPVFISSIASNIADQAPFSSAATIEPENAKHSLAAELVGKPIVQQSADYFYQQGQQLLAQQQYQQAKEALVNARDRDLLRFRAPSEINNIIKNFTDGEQIYFVDSHQALSAKANHGIIGNSLMLEHLHPTIEGYFVIADAFYQTIAQSQVFGSFPVMINSQQAGADLPIFDAEVFLGKAKIAGLMADYPFTEQPQKPKLPTVANWSDQLGLAAYHKQANWLTIARENLKRSNGNNKPLFMKSAKLLADAMPYDATHNYRAGTALLSAEQFSQARHYLKRAVAIEASNTNYALALSHAYLAAGQLQQAIPHLEQVLVLEPDNVTANDVLPQVKRHLAKQ